VSTGQHDLLPPRAKLTSRAARWATDALTFDDTTVSALARHLGVDRHTCWGAVEAEATRRLADPTRLAGVEVLGVVEHIGRPSRIGDKDRAVTGMVDLTRDRRSWPRHHRARNAPPAASQHFANRSDVSRLQLDPGLKRAPRCEVELDAADAEVLPHLGDSADGRLGLHPGGCVARPWPFPQSLPRP